MLNLAPYSHPPSRLEEHYEALANYYPDFPAVKEILHQISLMDVINLRA